MNKIVLTVILVIAIFSFGLGVYAGFPKIDTDIAGIGVKLIDALWVVFTIIAVVMFVVAGILFLTSTGDPQKIQQARNAFLWGVVGIAVAIIGYSITKIVINTLS
jgi:uncharacterized membrane protein SirB2